MPKQQLDRRVCRTCSTILSTYNLGDLCGACEPSLDETVALSLRMLEERGQLVHGTCVPFRRGACGPGTRGAAGRCSAKQCPNDPIYLQFSSANGGSWYARCEHHRL